MEDPKGSKDDLHGKCGHWQKGCVFEKETKEKFSQIHRMEERRNCWLSEKDLGLRVQRQSLLILLG